MCLKTQIKIQTKLLSEGYTAIKSMFSEPTEDDKDWIDRYHVDSGVFEETYLPVADGDKPIEQHWAYGWVKIDSEEGEKTIQEFLESENASIDALIPEKKQIISLFYNRDFKR